MSAPTRAELDALAKAVGDKLGRERAAMQAALDRRDKLIDALSSRVEALEEQATKP